MAGPETADEEFGVLRSKRQATRYQILVEIAKRQPAVNQQEIADAIGITAQAVSNYLQDFAQEGFVDREGRGRYEVTKEGVDWLISQTDGLRSYVDHVADEVLGQVDVETAIATASVEEGTTVSLRMQDGVLRALPAEAGGATAVTVTSAGPDEDVGITNVEGIVDYELGAVTLVSVPRVQDGGSGAVDPTRVAALAADHDRVAVGGVEAVVAAREAGLDPDIRFGTPEGVREAATKGLDVLLLAAADLIGTHTDALHEQGISYEVVEPTDEE